MTPPQANVTSAERIAELKEKIANAKITTSIESRARKNAMRNKLVSLLESDLATRTAERDEALKALEPFAEYASEVEQFVADRAADGGSPIMPTNKFRLLDFRTAARILAKHQSG